MSSEPLGATNVLTLSSSAPEEQREDVALRPRSLSEFVGQESIKKNLAISLQAARERKQPLEHVLLYGPPGLGKTSLAHLVAIEQGAVIRTTSGPALERAGDIASILAGLQQGDVLFVDEIHRLNRTVEEILYPAMEDFALDLVLGKGPAAKTMRLTIFPFTLIGATTRIGDLSAPLRDRFGVHFHLDHYEVTELEAILQQSAQRIGITLSADGSHEIAKRSRRTPRIANRLLRRVRDYLQVKRLDIVTESVANQSLAMLGIDANGLDRLDRRILEVLVRTFEGNPIGLGTLAAALGEDRTTIEDVYEPFLLREGYLERTARGRQATRRAAAILEQE